MEDEFDGSFPVLQRASDIPDFKAYGHTIDL
jgi:hypothetical protein